MAAPQPARGRRRCPRAGCCAALVLALASCLVAPADAFDILDPMGNVSITWDIMTWTTDGYVATVTINNFQRFRRIAAPGWNLSWNWTKGEIIWKMQGVEATMQGDCTNAIKPSDPTNIPHSCEQFPIIMDLAPDINRPYTETFANCCKGGVISPWLQDPNNSASSFQMVVGNASHHLKTVRVAQNFTLGIPGYTCAPPRRAKASTFASASSNHLTQALASWVVTCTYSQLRASTTPTCCVSFSTFYNETIIPCNECSCNCQNFTANSTGTQICQKGVDASELLSTGKKTAVSSQLQCSRDGCPINIHYHIKTNYREYWRAKVTIINRNMDSNYTDWNLVLEHPNFSNFTQASSFELAQYMPYNLNNTAVFWGTPYFNDLLLSAGPEGNVQSDLLFRKDERFTFRKGWAFPRRVVYNGDYCVMPSSFPTLPGAAPASLLPPALALAVLLALSSLFLIL
eukprot:SM000206S06266  [mRNA]  locus=s206:97908:100662:+ [translate_table: standard]